MSYPYWNDHESKPDYVWLLCIQAVPGKLTLSKKYKFTIESIHGPDGFIREDDGSLHWFDLPSNTRCSERPWQSSNYFKEL